MSLIEGEVEVLEIDARPQERGDRFAGRTGFDPRALSMPYRWFRISPRHPGRVAATAPGEREPDVLLEAGQIEPGDAHGDREGGPAQQMETR